MMILSKTKLTIPRHICPTHTHAGGGVTTLDMAEPRDLVPYIVIAAYKSCWRWSFSYKFDEFNHVVPHLPSFKLLNTWLGLI